MAIAVFASTNIDDIVLLTAFFGDVRLRRMSIVAGQFLGICILTTVSALVASASLIIPSGWAALLGIVPLGLGLRDLWVLRRDRSSDDDHGATPAGRVFDRRIDSQILGISAVTVANGGDNLGVYIPLFANNLAVVPLFAAVFVAMTAVWCGVGYLFVNNPVGAALVGRFGRILLPVVLIVIGVYILSGLNLSR
jgi:cadmium resistance protein CadD (predicted permease)